ncbi:hypothetical protein [Methylosoma difficile]
MFNKHAIIHARIKQFYLRNHTQEQWQVVANAPHLFNRVWRQMLKIPVNDMPPPAASR